METGDKLNVLPIADLRRKLMLGQNLGDIVFCECNSLYAVFGNDEKSIILMKLLAVFVALNRNYTLISALCAQDNVVVITRIATIASSGKHFDTVDVGFSYQDSIRSQPSVGKRTDGVQDHMD